MLVPMAMVRALDSRKFFKEGFKQKSVLIYVLMISLATLLKMDYRSRGEAERSDKWLLARDDGGET